MLLGIFRERLLVSRFYVCCSSQLDVYYAAFRLPDMIFQLVVIGALSAAFIPIFSEKLEENENEAYKMASTLMNFIMGFFVLLSLVIFVFAKPVSSLITGNFLPWQIELMTWMTRAMLIAQVFFLVSNFFSAMVQSRQRFLLPALSPVVYNLGIIFSIFFLSGLLGIWAATVGVLLGALLHLLIQIPLVLKLGFHYSFSWDWQHAGVRKIIKLMLPRTLALAAGQVEATVALYLATLLSPGSLTIYYLAQKLTDLPVRLLGTSFGQAALPHLSLQLARRDIDGFRETFQRSLSQILFLALPATAIFLVLRVQLVRFAYGSKSFPWEATIITGRTLAAIVFSIFSQSAVQLLVRGFYALHDTLTPFAVSCFSVIINVALSVFFIFRLNLGIYGLALAFSLSSFFHFFSLLVFFNCKKQKIIDRKSITDFVKMTVASAAAGFCTWVSMRFLDRFVFETTKTWPLLGLTVTSGFLGVFLYFLLAWYFKLAELKVFLAMGEIITRWRKMLLPPAEMIDPHHGV